MPIARISRRGVERVRHGHPWIYRSDIAAVDAEPGDLVRVTTERERPLGWAFWSSTSEIALRFVSTDTGSKPLDDHVLIRDRLLAAAAYRTSLDIDSTAYRVVSGEADRLPGLIVDRYGDESGVYVVVQTLTQASDRRLDAIVRLIVDAWSPAGVLARNDPKVRRLEGLEPKVEVVYGAVPPLRVRA